jgi:hypothetical protein
MADLQTTALSLALRPINTLAQVSTDTICTIQHQKIAIAALRGVVPATGSEKKMPYL